MQRLLISALGAIFLFGAPAFAEKVEPLTEDQAKRFVETLPALDAMGKELEESGRFEALNARTKPEAGKPFKPYSNAVVALKEEYPAEHARLGTLVGKHGFKAEEWGAIGDRVMVAYFAERMERENPGAMKQMEAMDASMLEMMPAHVQDQMGAVMSLITAVKNSPAEDRKAIKAVAADLDKFMDEQSAE